MADEDTAPEPTAAEVSEMENEKRKSQNVCGYCAVQNVIDTAHEAHETLGNLGAAIFLTANGGVLVYGHPGLVAKDVDTIRQALHIGVETLIAGVEQKSVKVN